MKPIAPARADALLKGFPAEITRPAIPRLGTGTDRRVLGFDDPLTTGATKKVNKTTPVVEVVEEEEDVVPLVTLKRTVRKKNAAKPAPEKPRSPSPAPASPPRATSPVALPAPVPPAAPPPLPTPPLATAADLACLSENMTKGFGAILAQVCFGSLLMLFVLVNRNDCSFKCALVSCAGVSSRALALSRAIKKKIEETLAGMSNVCPGV